LRTYHREFGLNYVIFRFFNTYGPNQSEDFVVPRFLKLALANQDIPVYGDGSQTRTFCYVDDNIDACLNVHRGDVECETLNIGSDEEMSILELAQRIIAITGSKSSIAHKPPLPEGDMAGRRPDISRMRSVLSRDLMSLEEGVGKLIAHYKARA
jgi:UDP-glucose 4-epimerase